MHELPYNSKTMGSILLKLPGSDYYDKYLFPHNLIKL